MKFGPCSVAEAAGAVLAHSVRAAGRRIGKGVVLGAAEIAALTEAGITEVTVARLAPDDVAEDLAAVRIAQSLLAPGLELTKPRGGRVNIVAKSAGVITLDVAAIQALNAVDEAITLATLPDMARVGAGALVGTVKVIPYAVPENVLSAAEAVVPAGAMALHPFRGGNAALILTRTEGMKDSLFQKAEKITRARLSALGITLSTVKETPHETAALTETLGQVSEDVVLILTASATSDRADVAPAALVAAGGEVTRFGMPVDPGNLLFIGVLGGRQVVGLPGCARSPALNGADWVLERLAAGMPVSGDDIAAMGVGGLLKEIPERGAPRQQATGQVDILLLASGASRRMGGEDKLLRALEGEPLLRRAARAAVNSGVGKVHVILPPDGAARRATLKGLAVNEVSADDWQDGMAASLRAGLSAVAGETQAVIVALADMPDVTSDHYRALATAAVESGGDTICRAVTETGKQGHPVLFPRRLFAELAALTGDEGARDILKAEGAAVRAVPTAGEGAVIDLDTPEAWEARLKGQSKK